MLRKIWCSLAVLCWVCWLAHADEYSETTKLARELGAKQEVRLEDGTRCDLLTDVLAIEVDYAKKWPEAIGQSLHYARLTKKRPGIILLYQYGDDRFVERCKPICEQTGIALFVRYLSTDQTKVEVLGRDPGLALPELPPPAFGLSVQINELRAGQEALKARLVKSENKTAEIVSWSHKLTAYLTGKPRPVIELGGARKDAGPPGKDCPGKCPCKDCKDCPCCPCFPTWQ